MKQARILVVLLAFALVAAACGSSDDTTTTAASAATTTTAAASEETTTTEPEAEMEIATDFGVDLENGTITVGLLSDLTGFFSFLVQGVVDGYQAYVDEINANGGINGLMIELEVFDTVYQADNTVLGFNELKDQVVAFGHSVGSPQTLGIREDLEAEGILAIPLTWYSGWTDPTFNSNLIHHGTPYCLEAMNILDFLTQEVGTGLTLALATFPGDYGLDSAAGVDIATEALGIEIVLDMRGQILPGEDMTPIGEAIADSGADIVYVAADPNFTFPGIYQSAIAKGMEAVWTGAYPTYSTGYLTGEFAEEIERDFYGFAYVSPWGGDSVGVKEVRDLMASRRPDLPPFDYYSEGVLEAKILEAGLRRAYDNGDMTRAGVLAAVKSFTELDFDGLAPPESYVGTPNEQVQRSGWMVRFSAEDLAAGGSGTIIVAEDWTGPTAAAYEFNEACYFLGS